MKKFMLKIEDNMAKADEIAIIDRLEKEYLACPDNYLYKYFTGQNAQWLRNKIKNDFFPALPYDMEVKIVEQAEEINDLNARLREIKFEFEKTKRDLSQTQRLNNYLKNKLGYARKILNDAMKTLNE